MPRTLFDPASMSAPIPVLLGSTGTSTPTGQLDMAALLKSAGQFAIPEELQSHFDALDRRLQES